MTAQTLDLGFWKVLERLRTTSQLVLIALENDDTAEVERLAAEAENLLAYIGPRVEERRVLSDMPEEAEALSTVLAELQRMNGAIIARIEERKRETLEKMQSLRTSRLKLVHYRRPETNPVHLDQEG